MEQFDRATFDSRSERYKSPYGAIPAGTAVTLHLRPRRAEGFSRGVLLARYEFDDNRVEEIPMPWVDTELGRDDFSIVFNPGKYVGLLWYSFRLERLDGACVISREYQLTVYDGTERVPSWFGRGMTYQIFPDRFYRTAIPDPTGMVGGRTVHQDWGEFPHWQANEKGEIRNRDFFGGSLRGVEEKLDYIASLGTETIYFCPIFEAAENHRYGTADYDHIDPMLGTEEDFRRLCRKAHEKGIKILLDGVFNHTGFVSKYFNGDGFYPNLGAYQSKESPYFQWFDFKHWPDKYEAWWGIYSLPAVNENNPDYRQFIFGGEDAVVRRWLRAGADGWRLDVADELPDDFVAGIHQAVRETNPQAVVIGEVWEDGTTKVAYNVRRRHLLGRHLDGLMNYPFRTAVIEFLLGGPGTAFQEEMETLRENYPPFAFYSAMNSLGTHDTLRILTYLGVGEKKLEETRAWRADFQMTEDQRRQGIARLLLGALILFTFPGSPTVYYGDEVGMEGFEDPFNRQTFPWGKEDKVILSRFRKLGQLRRSREPLRQGNLEWGPCGDHLVSYGRRVKDHSMWTVINGGTQAVDLRLDWTGDTAVDLLSGKQFPTVAGKLSLALEPMSGLLLE